MIVTFFDHYGATLLKHKYGDKCVLKPVPRSLSSSCGTSAEINDVSVEEIVGLCKNHLESIYLLNGEKYERIK